MAEIDELSRVIGDLEATVREGFKSVNKRLDALPCAGQAKKLEIVEQRVSKVEGKITIISTVAGFVGSIIFAAIGWFLQRIKF